jgi:hypothetical protein
MAENATTTYIVSCTDRTSIEMSISAHDLRAARAGDTSIRERIIQEYGARSEYLPTDDLFAGIGTALHMVWNELTIKEVPSDLVVSDSDSPTSQLEPDLSGDRTYAGGYLPARDGCDCECWKCDTGYHCNKSVNRCH